VEALEDRTLLTFGPPYPADGLPLLPGSSLTETALLTPQTPLFYQISAGADGRLTALVHAAGVSARLSLLGPGGRVLLQSDGQSRAAPDPAIDLHVAAGSYTLEVESLGGSGGSKLTATLTPTTIPFSSIPRPASPQDQGPIAVADVNGDGIPDLVTNTGVSLGAGGGEFRVPSGSAAFPTGADVVAVATGDFNGDHRTDVAFADNTGNVEVMLGNGDGTFRQAVKVAHVSGPSALASADFNDDGRADLAIADQGTGNLTVLLGQGDGTFHALDPVQVAQAPQALVVADFNGDGRPDLAVADSGSGGVEVLLGRGGGRFTEAPAIPVTLGGPVALAVADFNGDGRPDLAVADSASNDVTLLRNAGGGSFVAGPRVALAHSPRAVAAADLNGDGRPDLAVTESYPFPSAGSACVLMARADGSFQAPVPVLGGLSPGAVAAADLDGDGRPDLVVTHLYTSEVSVLLGDGAGGFLASSPPNLTPTAVADFNGDGVADYVTLDGVHLGAGDGTFRDPPLALPVASDAVISAVVAADFNGDGKPDLAVTDFASDRVIILLGNGDGTFRPAGSFAAGRRPDAVVAGDFNGDGKPDLAVADFFSGDVTVLLGNGDGTFRPGATVHVGPRPDAIAKADFNGDGRADLVVADDVTGELSVLLGNGDGTFRASGSVPGGVGPVALIAADLNGDGRPDLAVADAGGLPGTGGVMILAGAGDGTFGAARPAVPGLTVTPRALALGDFNGDGKPDLAVADYVLDEVTVLLRSGDGYRAGTPVGFAQRPYALASGDFNGDGRTDLIVSTEGATASTVLLARGDGGFLDPRPNPVGQQPSGVVAADFNGDGIPDLATCNLFTGDVSILLGNGDGTFRPAAPVQVGYLPNGIVTADFNGDGRADLAVLDAGSNDVRILLGNGDGTFRNVGAYPTGRGPWAITVGDLNRDKVPDLVICNYFSSDVTVLLGKGGGLFGYAGADPEHGDYADADLKGGGLPSSSVVGDFNGDGKPDLAISYVVTSDAAYPDDVVIWTGGGDGTFHKGAAVPTAQGDTAECVVAGDFNRDGITDLAVTVDQGQLVILEGDGRGGFHLAEKKRLPDGMYPTFDFVGDFNGDGRPDLAVTYYNSDQVSVFYGQGGGGFQDPVVVTPGGLGDAGGVTTADLNGDGRSDLVVAQTEPGEVRVGLGLAGGGFADPTAVALGTRNVPLLADLNGDSVPDLAVVDSKGEILVRFGRPGQAGAFLPPVIANPGFPVRDIAAVPTDRGVLLAGVDASDDHVSLFRTGKNGFERVGALPTGSLPAQVVVGDLDGDGRADLVIRNAAGDALTVYYGEGSVSPAPGVAAPLPFSGPVAINVGRGVSDVTLADVDGDGKPDIVLTGKASGDVRVVRNLGGRSFAPPAVLRAGTGLYTVSGPSGASGLGALEATSAVVAGRFTPDAAGAPDLVTLDPGSDTLTLLSALGGGRFTNPVPFATSNPGLMVRAADFNGDGLDDLAVADGSGVEILLNNGRGGFSRPVTVVAGVKPTGLTVADLNGDGKLDLVVGNPFGDVLILHGKGDGTFQPIDPVDKRVALAVRSEGSGGPRTAVLAEPGQNLVVMRSAGARTVLGDASSGLLAPSAVALADLNGDGIPDLIIANSGSNNVLVEPGLPGGGFGPAVNGGYGFFTGTEPVSITVADLDGDGRPDLVVANEGSNDVSVFLNRSAGGVINLVPGPRLKAGYGPTSTAVADVDGDGKPDIILSDGQSNDVRVLRNLGNGFFNDANPLIIPTPPGPGPVIPIPVSPGRVDVVTLNAGSNTLTLIPDIGHGGVPQSISSGGTAPVAGIEVDLGGGATGLLVANNGDGNLILFLAGADGLHQEPIPIEDPGQHPTALAKDQDGNIFVAFEGSEAALRVSLGLGPSDRKGEEGIGTSLLPKGPGDEQVVQLLPLGPSSPMAVATLLSVAPVVEAELAALPNQSPAPGPGQGPASESDGAEDEQASGDEPAAETAPAPASPAQTGEEVDTVVRLVAGLDETFDRARRAPSPDGPNRRARRAPSPGGVNLSRAVEALDALLVRWSPAARALPSLAPVIPVDLVRAGLAAARAVDAALESLTDEAHPTGGDRAGGPGPVTLQADDVTSADPANATAVGFAAVSRVLADLVRPPHRRPKGRRPPRVGDGSRAGRGGPGLPNGGSAGVRDGPA
jgi:hypothetical protein